MKFRAVKTDRTESGAIDQIGWLTKRQTIKIILKLMIGNVEESAN